MACLDLDLELIGRDHSSAWRRANSGQVSFHRLPFRTFAVDSVIIQASHNLHTC